MSRPDLLALTDAVLEDLTNKGTVRRARKELGQAPCRLSEEADGSVTVTGEDGTVCVLFADRPFDQWTCTCLATHRCRHIVRAVLVYQQEQAQGSVEEVESEPAVVDGAAAPVATFDPAEVGDDALTAALGAAAVRSAQRLVASGVLAHVGSHRGIAVVRIHHPVPVAVRFLAGADLTYVRCTCHDPDPCAHVAVAVAAARGVPFGDSGLRSTPEQWTPDVGLLTELRAAVTELARVGAEAGHRSLAAVWSRLAARSRAAELHHLADLLEELLEELARYEGRHRSFDASRLVRIVTELLARTLSLSNPDPGRVPDRLVAGSPAIQTRVARSRLVGLGTEFLETDDDCRVIAHLVDARSGAPMRVTRRITDEQDTPSWRLARGTVAGISISAWGGGQVMSLGGRLHGLGDFSHTNRSATGLPAGALDQVQAPFRVETITELATHQTRLPAVLGDRAAGSDLAACRVTRVVEVGHDPATASLVAVLHDGEGQPFQLRLRRGRRTFDGFHATAARLLEWQRRHPAEAHVSGRWSWHQHSATVDPFLLVGDAVPLQPHVAEPVADPPQLPVSRSEGPLTSPGALLTGLDVLLGELLVAGADRILKRDRAWREFIDQARRAGSRLVAEAAQAFLNRGPDEVAHLLLVSAFGHPLA
ncbi:hypothetical protein EII34_05415 [Arachnia propionica]|uniref:SWIM-type domain-containing protein n=1 Tax=Arachnia propionica TaxID=1750 RepID=A0A3P1T8Z4_9ACTN|nr:hypothetical protein [Arachnia propionica]RRD05655.1 hypothetical protein EII34_05415 [Arachnia propionica]